MFMNILYNVFSILFCLKNPYTGSDVDQLEPVERRAALWAVHDFSRMLSPNYSKNAFDLRHIDQQMKLLYTCINILIIIILILKPPFQLL